MKKLRNNKIRKLLAFMVALALMVSCMPSAYTISASEAFGDGTEDIFTDGEFTSEPAAEESTPDVSSADQEETEQAQQSTLTYENDSVKVTAEALEDGALPQNTALKADSVNENSSVSYDTVSQKLSAAATDKGSSLRGFFAYDVYFADGDGNRVEPNGRVRVTFEYKTPAAPELTDAASTSVTVEKLHYNSSTGDTDVNTLQANEDLKVLNVNESKQIQTLQVETGNAAVFAVMWDSPETADVEAEAVSGNEDEVSIASEELTDGVDISDEPEQDAAETPAAENPEVTPEAEPSEAPAENPDAEPTEAPAEDIASPEDVPAADENGETSLIKVLGDDTNLRVSPSTEAEVLATVNAGTQLTLLDTVTAEDGATWYKVSWEGTEAYIRSDMAQVVDSSDEAEEPEDVQESEEVSYSQEVGNVVVTATAAKGVIPEGAQFVVTPIEKGSDQYADIEKQLHEGAENESYTVAGFLAYDISFLNDDGTKIEPQNGSVRVSIAYKEAEIPEDVAETDTAQENMNVSLVHFVEDANGNVTEVVNMSNDGQAEVSTTDNGEIESANFETESFSTFSVVWLADNFTSVQTTSSYGVEETVDSAKRGITINMFNYNTDEINAGHSLKFSNGKDGVKEDYNRYRGPADLSTGIMQKKLGQDSYPIVDKDNKESSSYLFSTKEGTGKEFYSDANYLFKQDADGYYEYDSTKNFAQFNKNTKEFTVYKVPGSSKDPIDLQQGSKHGSFFPFNTLGDDKYWGIPQISEKSPDFHFGMTMSAKFIQPKDGKINGNNMVFEFSGDDDVWVYIDGVLVLDIGGIHNEVLGSINFADGTVKVGSNINTNLKKLFNDANANANIKGDFVSGKSIFKDYTAHTINFYYLERGKGDSNCKLKFNLPTVPKKSVTVEKQLSNTDKEKYANVEFKFQLLLQDDKGEYVPSNTAGTLSDDSEVEFNREEINGVPYDNVFTLKPGQKAKFSGLEENTKYKVQELGVSKDRYDRVLINDEETTNENGNVISREATVDSRPVVVVTNVLASVAELDFKKVNTKGAALSGAGFTLTSQADNSKTYRAESGDDGIINFENLPLGTYTLTETKVPDNYENRNTWIVKVEKDEAGTVVATLYEADGKTAVEKDSKDSYYHIVNYTHQELIESDVEYSKKAQVIDWKNRTYKIDISAESKSRSSSTVVTGAADIMLVLDVSGSMSNAIYEKVADNTEEGRSSLESGNTYYLKYNNEYYQIWKYKNRYYISVGLKRRDISDSRYENCEIFTTKMTRLDALKESVKQFINSTADKSSNSKIGIATFSWNEHGTTTDLLELENNKGTLIEKVNGLNADGGTDPDFGLSNAYDKLTEATEKGDTLPKYVILFTDGEPTGNSDDISQGTTWSTAAQNRAEATAKKLKDNGVSIYTIGFALSSRAEKFLAGDKPNGYPGIASSAECAKEAYDAAGLSELFRTFEQTIFNDIDITNATITDTIDPRFDLLDDKGNIITEKSLTNGTLTLENGGVVSLVHGNWQVQWTNVTIPNKNKKEPWTKSLNIKAKDTYIGGNDVTTNVRDGSNITFGNEKIYLPQPKVNVNAKIFINDKEITIYKGDEIPTNEAIRNELFNASEVTSYKDGKVGKADIGKIQLKWYKNPECTQPVATDTKGNPVYDLSRLSDSDKQPTADTNYYLKVTYDAGAPSKQSKENTGNNVAGGEDNIQEAINNNNPYGIYKIHVISGQIDIIKKVNEKSSESRTFQFKVTKTEKGKAEAIEGSPFTVTVPANSDTGTVSAADKEKLSNLSRGTYVVSEGVPAGYRITATDVEETNCQNSVKDNKTTFILGNGISTKSDVISTDYKYDPADGGVLGKVSYTNEYSVNLDLKKVDSSGNNELSGAEFTLEVKDGTTGQFDGNAYKSFEIEKDTVELKDLKPGLYKLTEIKAPKGYSLLGTSIYFQVRLGKVTLVKEDGTPIEVQSQSMWTLDEDKNVLTIKNTKLYSLPESGGPGTYGFTISGVAILATALLLFINNKRREEEAKRS
ncbi:MULTISPECIES: SpaA isopeptide-forming pilin-related protein [unclassified Blautia]|uniref:SpaA isopeptide-forming pilin-related protein n=1 Tax=unclassified Blautia TaxID=2648079 RepID=UPI001FD15DF5|nr:MULTISPECIES: SpaA isopeptide-forming pilin-related protein [unclassified Blautia]MCJ7862839.1 VWA domain-containing protein [Blautia sp. NSJ-157]MCJ7865651.1 VWA domain-containing protein [Blautia sp. NSJ-140]